MTNIQIFARLTESGILYGAAEKVQAVWEPGMVLLTPAIPSDTAYAAMQRLPSRRLPVPRMFPADKALLFQMKAVARCFGLAFPQFPRLPAAAPERPPMEPGLAETVCTLAAGRLQPDIHLVTAAREQGFWPEDVRFALDAQLAEGSMHAWPGICENTWGERVCQRCRSERIAERFCVHCGRPDCPICLSCEPMGVIRGCTRLVAKAAAPGEPRPVSLQLEFSLTEAQRRASDEVQRFLAGDARETLVWAACGAGKTEVVFAAIQQELSDGGSVLFAVPRRDVVRELGERLRQSFPDADLSVHYGGQPKEPVGQLVAATTHQVLRFYRRFDLVILDEVDAFPYAGSTMLRHGMRQARQPAGRLIEMTATPQRIPRSPITIPARHHGHPLPEPDFLKARLPAPESLTGEGLPQALVDVLENGQWLVFVPTVAAAKPVARALEQRRERRVAYSYAADPARDEKRSQLDAGLLDILVATSIMERGVTIPGIQVVVLYCDHALFDSRSLIQMAGRVGRRAEAPTGTVLFCGGTRTQAMRQAAQRIAYLNEEASRHGLLGQSV